MKIHFKITKALLHEIRTDLSRPHPFAEERLGFLGCKASSGRDGLLILAHSYLTTPDKWYIRDDNYGCVFGPDAILTAMKFSKANKACMFHVHMHGHSGVPWFSRIDLKESAKFVPDFWNVSSKLPHGTLVLSDNKAAGLCWYPKRPKPFRITKLSTVGWPMENLGGN